MPNAEIVDQCTLFPDRVFIWDLAPCCLSHDLAYGLGFPKGDADLQLYQCILETTGNLPLAILMLLGVSLFGTYFYNKRTK